MGRRKAAETEETTGTTEKKARPRTAVERAAFHKAKAEEIAEDARRLLIARRNRLMEELAKCEEQLKALNGKTHLEEPD